jgi:hypothetical protein
MIKNVIVRFVAKLMIFLYNQYTTAVIRPTLIWRNDLDYEKKRKFDDPLHLDRFGYKVYSQTDEDGIIQEIFKTFINKTINCVKCFYYNRKYKQTHWQRWKY